jgi:transposase InsO family protein
LEPGAQLERLKGLLANIHDPDCWDNAQAESFWTTMKVEFYDRYLWPTKATAKLAVGDWIDGSITDVDATQRWV